MIRLIAAALVTAGLAAPLYATDFTDVFVKKNANAAATPKALKKLNKQEKAGLLPARLESVSPPQITVKTKPIMGPDGLIPSEQKTYDTTNATVVRLRKQIKTLADLLPGEKVKLKLSDDGKTADVIKIVEKAGKKKA
jgi:hypothetical protein